MSKDNVTTLDDVTPAKAAAVKAEKGSVLKPSASGDFSGKRSMISIAVSKESGGSDAVFAGVNGIPFQIPRGKQWEVPRELAEALSNAVEFSYHWDENGKTYERIESPRFALTRIDLPD